MYSEKILGCTVKTPHVISTVCMYNAFSNTDSHLSVGYAMLM